jgi:hypothetical protein
VVANRDNLPVIFQVTTFMQERFYLLLEGFARVDVNYSAAGGGPVNLPNRAVSDGFPQPNFHIQPG